MAKRKELIRIKKGVYTYTNDYNQLELANKLKRPSYISLQTVLFCNNIIFQDFSRTVTSATNNNLSVKINEKTYLYYKIKDEILLNPLGVITENNIRIASVERAICDTIYLNKNYYFDNLKNINKETLSKMSLIYNKRVKNEVKRICLT